jgi:hypothetical protein
MDEISVLILFDLEDPYMTDHLSNVSFLRFFYEKDDVPAF